MNQRFLPFLVCAALLSPLAAFSQEATNAPASLDKNAFQILVRKNIFDPTRTGARPVGRRAPRVESFTFCGYEGPEGVAFFSGAGAGKKPLKTGETINGFKVGAVTFRSVELKPADGPAVTLAMGSSMRREENGPWKTSDLPAPAAEPAASPDAPAAASSSSANESDIIKRLRAKREEN
ncbi:MAG TPA: hypothetical protein VHB20_19100 [Verrucomicrobiae bacterium]|jgi:hypothetical protein|nr:hypothetical protein [Verrucomicrobiae bacterium]